MPNFNHRQHSSGLPDLSGTVLENYRILAQIGNGSYGTVYRAVDVVNEPGRVFALKCQWKLRTNTAHRIQQLRELELHELAGRYDHPGVVKLHSYGEASDLIFMALDYCADGDLFSLLTGRNPYAKCSPVTLRTAYLQLIDGLKYIHDLGISHRDLKPENILVHRGQLLITDFGLSTAAEEGSDFECGSSFYMSPECVGLLFGRRKPYNYRKSDIWSLGVIFVNIVAARNPWAVASPNDGSFVAYMHEPTYLSFRFGLTPEFELTLKGMLGIIGLKRLELPTLRYAISSLDEFRVAPRRSKLHQLVSVFSPRPINRVQSWAALQALAVVNDYYHEHDVADRYDPSADEVPEGVHDHSDDEETKSENPTPEQAPVLDTVEILSDLEGDQLDIGVAHYSTTTAAAPSHHHGRKRVTNHQKRNPVVVSTSTKARGEVPRYFVDERGYYV